MSHTTSRAFHALTNLAGEILDATPSGEVVALLLWMTAAVAIGIRWQRRDSPSTAMLGGDSRVDRLWSARPTA